MVKFLAKMAEKCAKYTMRHTAVKLETAWESENRVYASKLEYHIKRLKKNEKELLINNYKELASLLSNKLDCSVYKNINDKI